MIKEKRIKAEGNNRKRLSILQRKNEEEKKKRRRNKFPMHLMTNKEEHLQMKGNISHITFIVKDLEKTAHFFTQIFDAKEVYSSENKTFSIAKEKFFLYSLDFKKSQHRLGIHACLSYTF